MQAERPWRKARWIWVGKTMPESAGPIIRPASPSPEDVNRYAYFRLAFDLDSRAMPATAVIRLSTDGRYKLRVNGKPASSGPRRSTALMKEADRVDIASLLRPGRNVLAALVHTYGRDTSWYQIPLPDQRALFGIGGFFCEGRICADDSSGRLSHGVVPEPIHLDTGPQWRCMMATAWDRESPFLGMGFPEWYDARAEPSGWDLPSFDDSAWGRPVELVVPDRGNGADHEPFPNLVNSSPCMDPVRTTVSLPEVLEVRGDGEPCPIALPWRASPGHHRLIARFREYSLGCLGFDIEQAGEPTAGESRLSIATGERLDGNRLHIPPDIGGIANQVDHRYVTGEGRREFTLFEPTGMKYAQIEVEVGNTPLTLHALRLVGETRPDRGGFFECSDPGLNAIWKAGSRTVALCTVDTIVDCPGREQRAWLGDGYVSILVGLVSQGHTEAMAKFLSDAATGQRGDGMICATSCCDLAADGTVYCPDFALLWLLSCAEYHRYTGDRDLILRLFPQMARLLRWFLRYVDERNLLVDVPGWVFIEWAGELERKGSLLVLNALFAASLDAVRGMLPTLFDGLLPEARGLSDRIRAAIELDFWDEGRQAYRDSPQLESPISQQANAVALCFGAAPDERSERALCSILDQGRVALTKAWRWDVDRPFDSRKGVIMAQPFYARFLHQVLMLRGRAEDLLASIRRWLPMLEDGDTFRESWQLTAATSMCHGFSSTPTYDLSTCILGLSPAVPGFSRARLKPSLSPGIAWAKGAVPTPFGLLCASWSTADEGYFDCTVDVPRGMSLEVEVDGFASGDIVVRGPEVRSFRLPRSGA